MKIGECRVEITVYVLSNAKPMQSAATAPQQCEKRLPRKQGGTHICYAKKYAGKTPSIIIIPNLRRMGKSEITEIVCFLLCSMLVKICVKTLDVVQY